MKVGTEQVKHKILNKLKKYKANLRDITHGKFADELADEIIELFGGQMNADVKVMAMARGASPEEIELSEKVERAFGFDQVNMRPEDIEVYRWIFEQEAKGQTLRAFVEWAKHPDRLQYIRKYRKNPSDIKLDWGLAFSRRRSEAL